MPVNTIINNGSPDNRIDIVFMGDGYTASQIATDYYDDVNAMVNYLFDGSLLTQPLGRYEKFFNVHVIEVISNQSGADDPTAGVFRDTALDSTYLFDGVTQRLLSVDHTTSLNILNANLAGTGIDAEMRIVPINDTQYGGGGGFFATYAAGNTFAKDVALHEIGHSFADLADEYGGFTTTYNGAEPSEVNVSKDSTGAKWSHWLGYDENNGLGPIGAYEGGRYYDSGIYRPTDNSKMRSVDQPFDAVSREQFVLKFYELVDPLDSWSFMGGSMIVTDPGLLSVTPIDTDVIDTEWRVDGVLTGNTTVTFDPGAMSLANGTYTISARAYDPTDWVRLDRSSLEQTVAWTVTITNGSNIINGTPGNDPMLFGTAGVDTINGLAGDDILAGFDGNDALNGGDGADLLIGGGGADALNGGTGFDTAFYGNSSAIIVDLTANSGSSGEAAGDTFLSVENVRGSNFNDNITGDALANALIGQDGNDLLEGMAAGDALLGGAGSDTASYLSSTDTVAVNIGNGTGAGAHAAGDVLVGIENLTGSQFGDLLRGGSATTNNPVTDNVLSGFGGGDLMLGDEGNDTLFGGAGGDIMTGGMGNDSFLFDNASAEQDIITDFDQNGDDTLTFSGFGAGFDFDDFQLFTVNGNDVFVQAAGWQGGVVLKDAVGLVDASDFVFV